MSSTMVEKVTPTSMDGSNSIIRELNAIITSEFIGTSDLPSDECLSEAEYCYGLYCHGQATIDTISQYLISQFWPSEGHPVTTGVQKAALFAATEIMLVLTTPDNALR